MRPKTRNSRRRAEVGPNTAFLRSVNVQFDADAPDRISHFQPTSKSVALLRRLLVCADERAVLAVAPYGTGKSLVATYATQLLENRPAARPALNLIQDRLALVSPELGEFAERRVRSKAEGLVLTMSGHLPRLSEGLKAAAQQAAHRLGRRSLERRLSRVDVPDNSQGAVDVLGSIHSCVVGEGIDRLVVVWDEFGRHLETIVSSGRAAALFEVQTLAELAVRTERPPVSMVLLLHRGLMHYAASLPPAAVSEWKKVEGRFETLQYVDDSKEIYRLVAEVAASRLRGSESIAARVFAELAREALERGLFSDFTAVELQNLLRVAYPLEPTTLYLLPRLAARVAQNERTLFGFLYSLSSGQTVPPAALYDYFGPSMQADVGAGGTFKQWLETQSALGKAMDLSHGSNILKTACLLGLGVGGHRSRTTKGLLLFASRGIHANPEAESTVDVLIERKLLLHRVHSDEITVWHGTDVDLRGRLEEEKQRQRGDFQFLPFVTKELPPPAWRPAEYNAEYGIRRYFAGVYQNEETLDTLFGPQLPSQVPDGGPDGSVFYLMAESEDALRAAEAVAIRTTMENPCVIAIPRSPLALSETALELFCLLRMSLDADLVGADPLIGSELQQLIDDARAHLQLLAERLTLPAPAGPRWFCDGRECSIDSPEALRTKLSDVARRVFPKTPRLFNEMIVRRRPSAVVVNARKKLLMGILERSGTEDLGIRGQFPDASMLRTILVRPGLYRANGTGGFRYAQPDEIEDPGLRAVWERLRTFFTEPSEQPKSIAALLSELMRPPYGVREGLLPILFAAAFRAFPTSIALQKDGLYLQDVLPSEIETLCKEPDRFALLVLSLDANRERYLSSLLGLFGVALQGPQSTAEVIRLAFEVVQSWSRQLPPGAWSSVHIAEASRPLRDALQQEPDPVALLFKRIPRACGAAPDDSDSIVQRLREFKLELEGVADTYRKAAEAAVRRAMQLEDTPAHNLRSLAATWSSCFDDQVLERGLDAVARGLVQRARAPYVSDDALMDSFASLLVGKSVARWDDSSLVAFQRELTSVVRRIEEIASAAQADGRLDAAAASRLSQLVAGRIRVLYSTYLQLTGSEGGSLLLSELSADKLTHGGRRGNIG